MILVGVHTKMNNVHIMGVGITVTCIVKQQNSEQKICIQVILVHTSMNDAYIMGLSIITMCII